ncbi:MAG: YdcF family protein [Pseudomonadota bacterium]
MPSLPSLKPTAGANKRLARKLKSAVPPGRRGLLAGLVLTLVFPFLGGFLYFTSLVPGQPLGAGSSPRADAIVVLTGGADRIVKGLELLDQGRGQRLLISGVNPAVSDDILRDRFAQSRQRDFDCCIDIDRAARDTIGNATETAAWVTGRGYRSLIVVTGAYHMPRSLFEMRKALPSVTLSGFPVYPDSLRLEHWWRDPSSLRILTIEYLKYLASLGRSAIQPSAV